MIWAALSLLVVCMAGAAVLLREVRGKHMELWLPAFVRGAWREPAPAGVTRHLLFCFVDHFEPRWRSPSYETECARVARWREGYPRLCDGHRDADGRPPVHSFFYPEEEYRPEHLDALVELCRMGLGEIEIHLHHDQDTADGLRQKLDGFTRTLVERHDALPTDPISGQPMWAFIHGNWALDNSHPSGRWCGVQGELAVLREQGCYADFTLPSAPSPCQTRTINSIYYAASDPARCKSHDHGVEVRVGGTASGDLMLIQGPLGLQWHNRKFGIMPRIENADIRASSPPSAERIESWVNTGVHVRGRPEWVFVKIHTHGAQDTDADTLLGDPMHRAFTELETRYNDGVRWKLHYVSAREMYNLAKAAEAGMGGDPNAYRDYVVARPAYRPPAP
ncbi:MAG: hypothetical protein KGJ64_01405 [Betaproteobacteria bacterium]|nr:hypothetical protein [Betaproteobacteria bacterium]